jgi:hypothetical protein
VARSLRALVLYAATEESKTFSYQTGWPRAIARDPRFDTRLVNVAARSPVGRLAAWWAIRRARADVVVALHSVFSNARMLEGRLFDAVRKHPAPKVYFIGNEYKLMPEKMAFAQDLGVALLISQSGSAEIHRLYRERLGCDVAGIPNTGVDLRIFHPTTDPDHRPIDLGYRADDSPVYLGHDERRRIADHFSSHAAEYGLKVDISMSPGDRLPEREWAAFLNRCRGQLGTEAGGDFFSLADEHRVKVNAFVAAHPQASFDAVYDRFFRDAVSAPLRIISGRNVEAAATRTVQLLFEGGYDGYLRADEHYIALRKDFGNVSEALARFRDRAFCARLTANAYDLAAAEFTYDALVGRLRDAVAPLVS